MATTALAIKPPRLPMPHGVEGVDLDLWTVLTDVIFPAAKSAEAIVLALRYCRARNLDVLKKPVHIVPVWSTAAGREVETIWPGISEIETTASRTDKWAGMDAPVFGAMMTRTFHGRRRIKDQWKDIELTLEFPEFAAVTVYRLVDGQRYSFTEPAFWLENYGRQGGGELPNAQWEKRPRGMIVKVAKAFSLRAGFPEEATVTAEEMVGGELIEGRAEPAAPKWSGPPPRQVVPPAEPEPAETPKPAEPLPPTAPPPEPAAAGQIIDPTTGEVLPNEPHALPWVYADDGEEAVDWRAWGTMFVAAIRSAPSKAAIDGWMVQNHGALAEMENAAPKLFRLVKAALAECTAKLTAEFPG